MKSLLFKLALLAMTMMVACNGKEKVDPDNGGNDNNETLEPGLIITATELYLTPVYTRKDRNTELSFVINNPDRNPKNVTARLVLPSTVSLASGNLAQKISLPSINTKRAVWNIRSSATGQAVITVRVETDKLYSQTDFTIDFHEALAVTSPAYIPTPVSPSTGDYLVGAFHCPLWYPEPTGVYGLPTIWNPFKNKYSERIPVLGMYNENNPEIIDWEIKYAAEHGISFFADCWFRNASNPGKSPVTGFLDHWSRRYDEAQFKDHVKLSLLYENENPAGQNASGTSLGAVGATAAQRKADFLNNLVPYWIESYFKKSYYLKVEGNKPYFGIIGFNKFVSDMGSEAEAIDAITQFRQQVVAAGFSGLFLYTQYVQNPTTAVLAATQRLGFDAITSYHMITFTGQVPMANYKSQSTLTAAQEAYWPMMKSASGVANCYPTVSMGWNSVPWGGSPLVDWMLTPVSFASVCAKAKSFVDKTDNITYGPKIIMLDNWNEFAEGHYIAPTQKYGFQYLDAVHSSFATTNPAHTDIVPQDIGRGPYEYPIGE